MTIWLFAEATHEPLGALDCFSVLRATQRYDAHGEIEIQAPAVKAAGLLRVGTVVWIARDRPAYIIETVNIKDEEEQGAILTATGFAATALLGRRAVLAQQLYNGAAGVVVGRLVDEILRQPKRGYDRLDTSFPAIGTVLDYECEPVLLDESVISLCKAGGIGLGCGFDLDTLRLSIWAYQGVDRTVSSDMPVVFSPAYNNIQAIDYTDSVNSYRNVAYVLGPQKEEGVPRVIVPVPSDGAQAAGYERFEVLVTASSAGQAKVKEVWNDETESWVSMEPSPEELSAQMSDEGRKALAERPRVTSAEGEVVSQSKLYRFGVDYSLGDMVTLRIPQYEIEKDVRVSEITETYEDGAYTMSIQLGDGMPTLIDRIKLRK